MSATPPAHHSPPHQHACLLKARYYAFAFALAISGRAYAPLHVSDIHGNPVPYPDRPIYLSTYEQSIGLFLHSPSMRSPKNSMGFLNISMIDITEFSYLETLPDYPLHFFENITQYRTSTLLATSRILEDPLAFNGRVVVDLHGDLHGDDLVSFLFHNGDASFEPERFGVLLGKFFKTQKLKVSRVDILGCNGEHNVEKIFKGLKKSGMKNLKVKGYAVQYVTLPNSQEIESDTVLFEVDDHTYYSAPTADLIIYGKDDNIPAALKLQFDTGTPENTPPSFTNKTCCKL